MTEIKHTLADFFIVLYLFKKSRKCEFSFEVSVHFPQLQRNVFHPVVTYLGIKFNVTIIFFIDTSPFQRRALIFYVPFDCSDKCSNWRYLNQI